MKDLEIDFVIETALVAMYAEDVFAKNLFLKGGQALRIKEKLKERFSADIDFSTPGEIDDEAAFFELLNRSLVNEFYQHDLAVIDFKWSRRPKKKDQTSPDHWLGWGIEFKLIHKKDRNLQTQEQSRLAIVPRGSSSPKITLDISSHEYCGAVETVKVRSVNVSVYSRMLLLVEKIRAICQQHQDYPLKKSSQRSRDYFDIERLWSKVINDNEEQEFLRQCGLHLPKVFGAKDVDLILLDKIFEEPFLEVQERGWAAVRTSAVGSSIKDFEYYKESLKLLVGEIKKNISLL